MMSEGPLSYLRCSIHNLPITRIKTNNQLSLAERVLCSQCDGEGSSINVIYRILDGVQQFLEPIHKIYNGVQQKLSNLKSEIAKMTNKVFSYMERAINQSEFEIMTLEKYIKYKDYYKEFKIEDLQKIIDFVYNDNIEQSLINQTIKQLNVILLAYRKQLIELFNKLIELIKTDGIASNHILGTTGSQQNINNIAQYYPRVPIQPQIQPSVQPLVQPPFKPPVKPPVQPPIQPPVQPPIQPIFTKKNSFETSTVASAIFNSKGDLLFQGQYPYSQHKNLEIKFIDNNLDIIQQTVSDLEDENKNEQVTALALNDVHNQLFVGYETGDISTYQCWENVWKKKGQVKSHNYSVAFLIMNSSKTELFSGGHDKIIKGYNCQQDIVLCQKVRTFATQFNDMQINNESTYLFLNQEDQLEIYQNSDGFPEFQQIKLEQEKVQCLSPLNNSIYIGTNFGNIHIFNQQEQGKQFIQIFSHKLQSQLVNQIKYSEESKLLLVRFQEKVVIYQIDFNNSFKQLQEIFGCFYMSNIHSNQKYSQIILFSDNNFKATHYICQSR